LRYDGRRHGLTAETNLAGKKRSGGVQRKKPRWLEYELAFVGYDNLHPHGGRVMAEVTSPLLDRVLHPRRAVRVEFTSRSTDAAEGATGFVLDAFQMEALAEYLRRQEYVRRAVERAFEHEMAVRRANGTFRGRAVWNNVKFLCLALGPRAVPTPQTFAALRRFSGGRFTAKHWRRTLANSDKPDTRSTFELWFEVAWGGDHGRRARFRDGKFVGTFAL
jgi:hypothetical protein